MATRIRKNARHHLYITEHMEALGLDDTKLAGRMDTDRTTVWRWRTQQHRLNPQKIAHIADALGLEDPRDLFRPPSQPSLDALVASVPEELRATAIDIVRRLVGKQAS